MPPATSTSVPAAAMIRIADCWSRMLSRFGLVANESLVSARTANRMMNGMRMPAVRTRAVTGLPGSSSLSTELRALMRRPRPTARRRRRRRGSRWRVMASPASSATIRPRRMTSTRWDEAEDLLELGRDQDDAEPVGREARDEVVDRALRADVDAARRLVRDHHARLAQERPGEQHLLLIASRERAHRRGVGRPADVAAIEHGARGLPLARAAHDAECAHVAESRERRVLDHRAAEDQAVVLAGLGDHHEACREAAARAPAERLPGLEHRRSRLHARGAVEGTGQLGASRPDQPGHAEDLARAQIECRARHAGSGQLAHREPDGRVAPGELLGRERRRQRPAEHRFDQRRLALHRRRRRPDDLAVAQHGDRVGEVEHLAQEVRDQEDRRPCSRQRADDLVQLPGLVLAERSRGLVHDDQLGVARERSQDLDLLLLGGPQPAGRHVARRARIRRWRRGRRTRARGSAGAGSRGSGARDRA